MSEFAIVLSDPCTMLLPCVQMYFSEGECRLGKLSSQRQDLQAMSLTLYDTI